MQLAAIHEVRKRDMELLVKKMKSCAERAVMDNQVSIALYGNHSATHTLISPRWVTALGSPSQSARVKARAGRAHKQHLSSWRLL